jgi:hypothetical protein
LPGDGFGGCPPPGAQLGQRDDVLVGAGGKGGLLAKPHDLDAAGLAAVSVGERRHQLLQVRTDRSRSRAECREQRIGYALDLERRGPAGSTVAIAEGDRQPLGKQVGKHRVVDLAERDRGIEEHLPVYRTPPPVRPLHLVRDDQVRVQIRVTGGFKWSKQHL